MSSKPFTLVQGALSAEDIAYLKDACKRQAQHQRRTCYVLVDDLQSPTFVKVRQRVAETVHQNLHYLNDTYLYTDESSKTDWHIDSELFAFENAVNAWILLSPDTVSDPLGFIENLNESSDRFFHRVRIDGDRYVFGNYHNGGEYAASLESIEGNQVRTPEIEVGDILVFDPKRFHKTNTNVPKHAFVIKFLFGTRPGFLSETQVDPFFWPEVGTFNRIVSGARDWDDALARLKGALDTDAGRTELSASFYPDKLDQFTRLIETL